MTSVAARAFRAAALPAAALLCGGCALLPRPAAAPAPAGTTTASGPARARGCAPPGPRPTAPAPSPAAAALLPFGTARLQAAAALAGRFTAAWDSWSWRQPPAAWLAALQPMAAASLEPVLAQAAGDRGALAGRAAGRQSAVATVTGLRVADLTPGSVTVTVTAAQAVTTSGGVSRSTVGWAVTLTPDGTGWLVWDIEPAGAGN